MKISLQLLLTFQFLFCIAYSCENSQNVYYPLVSDFDEWNIDDLLDKGEKCLLKRNHELAIEIFSEAIELCFKKEKQEIRLCRGLIDRSIARASIGDETEAIQDLRLLQKQIETFKCTNATAEFEEEFTAGGKPILGDDLISIEDCVKRTENTVSYIKDILALAPVKAKWKAAFISTLYLMEDQAIQCCRAGGVWKACLQPLLEKWLELKDWERECRRSGHWYLYD